MIVTRIEFENNKVRVFDSSGLAYEGKIASDTSETDGKGRAVRTMVTMDGAIAE